MERAMQMCRSRNLVGPQWRQSVIECSRSNQVRMLTVEESMYPHCKLCNRRLLMLAGGSQIAATWLFGDMVVAACAMGCCYQCRARLP